MSLSVDPISNSYLSALNSQAAQSSASAKADKLKNKAQNLQDASYEELEETMKTFESYLLEQTLKEFKESIKEIRGDNDDEDPFMQKTTDMYMDQMIGTISKHMVEQFGQQVTKDLTDQTARMYGIEIPGEEKKAAEAAADAQQEDDSAVTEVQEEA